MIRRLLTLPMAVVALSWAGTAFAADAAAVEKGKAAYDEAVKQLVDLVSWFHLRPKDQRKDRHRTPPTIPIPWRQQSLQADE